MLHGELDRIRLIRGLILLAKQAVHPPSKAI